MIDFVSTPPFLRIALRVAMTTMNFHIAQTDLFLRISRNAVKCKAGIILVICGQT